MSKYKIMFTKQYHSKGLPVRFIPVPEYLNTEAKPDSKMLYFQVDEGKGSKRLTL